ncbi:putative secreted protein [Corynebacterium resistens DSM 45100]|uniref:Secreted protein n=1 Tax=Corynebacterium resistens (strain DSM 45100 / JCM 12819 / GTC 2026 / SICGH 158) TaxID=662755 RepID=F8DXU1_CORRG|nr:SLC13 family permease [Corynebacterium resistens]AEI08738.1 putative secreted protein [Corynebacterium resistens DSM 45100]
MSDQRTATKYRHSDQADETENKGNHAGGFLGFIEKVGNKLPDPFWLFVILGGLVLVSSYIGHKIGLTATNPEDGKPVEIVNLLSADGLKMIVEDAVENYVSFPPLGLIITVMLGVAVAEHAGLISAVVRAIVSKVGPKMLTFVVALAGVTGSVASDAVYVILIPLGAVSFRAMGRSPIVGAMVAFAASSAGFNSSLVLNITDVLLGGISTSAAHIVDKEYFVSPLANYFFVAASAIVLALIITVLTEGFMNRRTEQLVDHSHIDYSQVTFNTGRDGDDELAEEVPQEKLTAALRLDQDESRALKWTGLVAAIMLALYFALLFVPFSPLQGEGGDVMSSPLITAVAVPIAVTFLVLGIIYGVGIKSITSPNDVPTYMAKGLKTLVPMMVLFFAVSQFLAWFKASNLGSWTAIKGAELLQKADLPPLVLFGAFVVLVALINLFITSGSAQWALMAPIVVPMFMYVGFSPEVTQMLFRIGDSPSNIITPMSPYFALALTFLQRYYKKAGIGTLMSLALPYSIAMLVGWFLFFALWWAVGLPLGPGTPMDYPAPQ